MAMQGDPEQGAARTERLDADAVCSQCGTVNTEETLICPECGNNLRTQRQVRLAAEGELEAGGAATNRRKYVSGVLAVLGILLVVWTALNVDRIMDWLIMSQVDEGDPIANLHRGELGAALDEMAAELAANLPTESEIAAAVASGAATAGYEGYYAVDLPNEVAFALVRQHAPADAAEDGSEQYLVVGKSDAGELRGVARRSGNRLTVDWNRGAALQLGDWIPASGVAIEQEPGVFDVFGITEVGESGDSFLAYKIPGA